ncbi:MAG: DUF4837 family protein [Gemmatimonadetes bacterium]|nr:DUF4837 family protein [Gemmatimonadota bacterium]NIO31253.1 DUF4837 family protein [Gemmatimonadota bacterium]
MITQRTSLVSVSVLLVASSLPSCKAPQAFGDRNSIIALAESTLWGEVGPDVMKVLEQRVFTTRPERKFEVTYLSVGDTLWEDMRIWQQVVVLGSRENRAVRRILDASPTPAPEPPAIVQAEEVWARNQLATALLLPSEGQAEAVRGLLPELYDLLERRYDEWIIDRMYTTGVNDSLAEALREYGFTLQLPSVYLFSVEDSLFRFGNPYRQGDTDLLRSILLTWRSGSDEVTPESLRAWRQTVGESQYDPPQDMLDEGMGSGPIEVNGLTGLELRGVWQDRADFPAAGPFITRTIACPRQDRTYYIDAWLFAPGTDKYPYLRQLEILLDSFRCAGN